MDMIAERPCYGDVTTSDDVRHILWRCEPQEAEFFV